MYYLRKVTVSVVTFSFTLMFILLTCCGCATTKVTYIPNNLKAEDKSGLVLVHGCTVTGRPWSETFDDTKYAKREDGSFEPAVLYETWVKQIDGRNLNVTNDFWRGTLVKVYLEPGEHTFTYDHYGWGPKMQEVYTRRYRFEHSSYTFTMPEVRYYRKSWTIERTGTMNLKKGKKYTWHEISKYLLKELEE